MARKLKHLVVDRVDLVDRGANPDAHVVLFKRDKSAAVEPPANQEVGMSDITPTDEPVAEETVAKADYDAVVTELTDLKARVAELETPADEVEIDKAELPEAVRKALEEADALRAEVSKMKAEQRAESFVRKAADEFSHVGPADEIGAVLELLDRVDAEQAQVLERTLKAANARIAESGLFGEVGSDAEGGDDAKAKAESLIAKAVEGGLSRPDAMRKVFTENPELMPPARAAI